MKLKLRKEENLLIQLERHKLKLITKLINLCFLGKSLTQILSNR